MTNKPSMAPAGAEQKRSYEPPSLVRYGSLFTETAEKVCSNHISDDPDDPCDPDNGNDGKK